LSRLNLPAKPFIMEKFTIQGDEKQCGHAADQYCCCYEYLTWLDRPDYKDKGIPDSPEPETRHVGVNGGIPGNGATLGNGTAKVSKKLSLVEYQGRKSGKTPKSLTSTTTVTTTATTTAASTVTSTTAPASRNSPTKPAGKRRVFGSLFLLGDGCVC
jgi:hypothetical protein